MTGKRVLVAAAGVGIGRASAIAMAHEGAQVFATDVNMETLSTIREANLENIEIFELDARDNASVSEGVARAMPGVLFNCAGLVHHGTTLDASDDELETAFDLNLRSMVRTIRATLPGMLERGGGSIINMSSAVGSIIGGPSRFIYATTKAAVAGLTKSVAVDYITKGIRCNCICPGTVETPSWHDRGTARVVYLASDESAFTSGHPHIIDGGWSGQ